MKVIDFPNKQYEQYLYYLTAKALINVQYVEKAIKCICCIFTPKGIKINPSDILSNSPKKFRATLGQIINGLKMREIFTKDFDSRLTKFVADRNKFVHGYFIEQLHGVEASQLGDSKEKEYEEFCKHLIEESNEFLEICYGLYYVAGEIIQKNIKPEEFAHISFINDFKQYKKKAADLLKAKIV